MDKDAGMTVKPRGGKAFNKLGITTIDIISQMFTTKAGRADKNAYQLFWNLMNDLENTTIFINEVLSKLLNYEPAGASSSNASSGGSSSSSSSSSSGGASQSGVGGSLPGQQAPCAVSIESLLTTLSFITLQLDFNMQDARVRQHLDTWTKQVANGQLARAYPAIKDVMRVLVLRCEGGDMFGPLIIGCSTMHSVSDFQRLSDIVSFPTLDEADLKSGDACFLYPYLRRCLSHPTAHRSVAAQHNNAMMMGGTTSLYHAVLANTANKMLTLPQQMKASPRVAETTFCSLLHMLRHVLSLGIHTDVGHLRSLQAILQPFYLWPLPYASMTRDLLVRLQQELRMPGTLLRAKIGEEIVCADVEEAADEPVGALFYFVDEKDEASLSAVQTMQLKQLKSEVLQPTRRTRSNYNNHGNNYNNRSNASSSSSSSSSDEPALLTPSLQAQIVLNMIHTDAGPLTEADVNNMKALNADTVGQVYRRAMSMTGEVLEKQEQVKELRAKQAQLLRQMLKEKAASSSGGGDVKLPELFCQPPYLPQLPAVSHQMYARTLTFSFPTFDAKTRTLDFPTSSLYPDLIALCEAAANKALTDTDSNNTASSSPSPVVVRIAIAGGDELTHHFLCAYMLLRSKHPHFFTAASPLQFRFYLVPFQRNAMAAWLARHDSWYHRHVYQPFRTPTFVIPSIKSEGGEQITEADDKIAVPPVGVYLRSLMELYAREAIYHIVEFHLYQCTAWTYPEARDPSHIIPFCQRMEIGVNAVPGGGGGGGGGGAGAAANNADDFLPPDIIVKFTKMDLSGHVVETVCDDGAPYSMIVLSSVPRKSDASFPSSPACPWLEMYAKPHRTFQKSAARKNTLVNDPRQHVVELELTCVQPSYQFGVLLDGSYFGPYHKIKIGPIVTADEKQGALAKRMKFAIQNYFPIDV